ncbi:unnamed protein product [Ambrosiozyma monospora]|uniref:Unnamed protein product n=1 Tax=Ambrosiozyma monospora TaxID=43982 RepID=A0ACB5TC90_AMBMO|nr:unnamed protein product [Ambrosiozyma monospora]
MELEERSEPRQLSLFSDDTKNSLTLQDKSFLPDADYDEIEIVPQPDPDFDEIEVPDGMQRVPKKLLDQLFSPEPTSDALKGEDLQFDDPLGLDLSQFDTQVNKAKASKSKSNTNTNNNRKKNPLSSRHEEEDDEFGDVLHVEMCETDKKYLSGDTTGLTDDLELEFPDVDEEDTDDEKKMLKILNSLENNKYKPDRL